MKRPITTTNPQQKYLAELLATGTSIAEAAKLAKVKPSYVEVLLTGTLFPIEIDRARDRLIRERLQDFGKAIADELPKNVQALISIRDDANTPVSAKLRAIELLIDRIVPRPRANEATEVKSEVRVVLSDERARAARSALDEAIDVTPSDRDSQTEEE